MNLWQDPAYTSLAAFSGILKRRPDFPDTIFSAFLSKPFHQHRVIDAVTVVSLCTRQRNTAVICREQKIVRANPAESTPVTYSGRCVFLWLRTILPARLLRLPCCSSSAARWMWSHAEGTPLRWSVSIHYDIVFMDCNMPDMNGFEATDRDSAAGGEQKTHSYCRSYRKCHQGVSGKMSCRRNG